MSLCNMFYNEKLLKVNKVMKKRNMENILNFYH